MASKKIKGITIEIDGDTTKLGTALKSVESQAIGLQGELKGVNQLLKYNPSNVELLNQKQKILNETIATTKEKLDTLKKAQKQVQEQFDKGEITEQQFRDFQREIVATESKLKKLKDQAKEFGSVFEQELKNAGKKTQEFGNKVEDAGQKMIGVSAAATGVLTAGLAYNVEMEKLQMDLEVLLGSADAAKERIEQLKKMGAETPFETDDLVKASKMMLSFGLDADKTNHYLEMLGDIAMGDASKLSYLTRAFSQIGSNTRATMEDINQMVDQGFNPLVYIADKTGESMFELRERVSEGKVSFNEIAEAMETATGKGGIYYQSMDKASETTAGKISTLKDNFNIMLGTLTESLLPIFEKIVDALSKFANWFSQLSPAAQNFTVAIVAILAALAPLLIVIGNVIKAVGVIMPVIGKLGTLLSKAPVLFGAIKAGVTTIISVLSSTLMPIFTAISSFITGTLIPAIGAVVTAIGWPVIAIAAVIAIIVTLYAKCEWFRDLVHNILNGIVDALKWVGSFLLTIASWIYDNVIKPILVIVLALGTLIVEGIINYWKTIISILITIATWIYENVIKPITDYFIQAWDYVTGILATIGTWINENVIQPILKFFTSLYENIKNGLLIIWNSIIAILKTIVNGVNDYLVKPILKFFTTLWNNTKQVFNSVKSFFVDTFKGAYDGIKNVFGNVKDWFRDNVWNRITSVFSSARDKMAQIGRNIWEGLKSAFKNPLGLKITYENASGIKGTVAKALGLQGWPRLSFAANGAVLKSPTPLLAGEYPNAFNNPEIVTPQNIMRETMMEALTSFTNTRYQNRNANGDVASILNSYMPLIVENMTKHIVLDDKTLVGKLAPRIDKELGVIASKKSRGY